MNKKTKIIIDRIEKVLKDNMMYQIPVNVVELAQKMQFKVLQLELDYDGAILTNKKPFKIGEKEYKKAILVNINHAATRKRFTIAHELSHWITATDQQKQDLYAHRDDSSNSYCAEPEINSYASELLMPHGLIKQVLNKVDKFYYTSPTIIMKIADLFKVSYSAAKVRLEKFVEEI